MYTLGESSIFKTVSNPEVHGEHGHPGHRGVPVAHAAAPEPRGASGPLCCFACRYGVGWRAFVVLDDADTEGVPLHEGCLEERPEYTWLEAQINQNHPQPRWARKLGEVDQKGLRFMRGPEGGGDAQ